MRASPSWRRWSQRLLWGGLFTVGVASVPTLVGLADTRPERLRAQLRTVQGDIDRARVKNAALAQEVDALRTDIGAIESHARDELGMVYPGDLVLRLDPELLRDPAVTPGSGVTP